MIDNHTNCILAVCRDEAALDSVLSIKGIARENLIIASDDIRLHKNVKAYGDLKIVYYSKMEALFDVAPDVLQILKTVNHWLRNLADEIGVSSDILYWEQHVEGGERAQRIQDAIQEARSCFALFDQLRPSKLIIGAASKPYWEDNVLITCALQRNIPVKKLKSFSFLRMLRGLWQKIRPVAKEMYRIVMTIDSLLRRNASGYGTKGYGEYVAIQCCSSVAKHLNHTLPLFKALERAGMKSVIVTSDIGRNAKVLRSQDYKIAELEAWGPPTIILRSWYLSLKAIQYAKSNFSAFLIPGAGGEYATLIRSVLMQSMRNFFLSELPYRIRYYEACKAFFTKNKPVAARLWTRILIQGVLAYRAIAMAGRMQPLLFWQAGWPYNWQWPYIRYDVPADIIFCLSAAHRKKLIVEGQSGSQIFVSAIQWLAHVKDFSTQTTPYQSRINLGVSPQAKLVIFCDSQVVLGGYLTASEQFLLVSAVVELAEKYEDVCVLIKPHAGHKPGQLEATFKNRGVGRVIWIPGKALPYEGLNAANVVLTKFSTLVAEAMVLGVPSICVLLDKDMRWAIYEDAVDYALRSEILTEKLEALRDENYYEVWAADLREKQKDYMTRHFPEPTEDCYALMASKIKTALRNKG